jgi:CheY-like chemotaxis protein
MEAELAGIHVLLVDDNEDALIVFGAHLTHLGAIVTVARNGPEALDCLTKVRADVIVTDLSMPGMDGIEFVRRLRRQRGEDTNPTPVIGVTAFPYTFSPRVAVEPGFRAFLVKPVAPSRLAEEVRRTYDDNNSQNDESRP